MAPLDRRQFCRALGVAAAGGLAGCLDEDASAGPDDGAIDGSLDDAPRHDWSMHGYDAANTRHHPNTSVPDGPVSAEWTPDLGTIPAFSVVDGTLFGPGSDGQLTAVDPAEGRVEWRTDWENDRRVSRTQAAVHGGTVYAVDEAGTLSAVDAADGTELWTHSFEGRGAVPKTALDGTVYAGDHDGPIVAFDAQSGDERWRFDGPADGEPVDLSTGTAVVDGTLYVGTNDGLLFAVDTADGTLRWQTEIASGYFVASDPTVFDGTVYVGSQKNRVVALDATSGERRWTHEVSGNVSGFAASDDGLFATSHSRLIALDPDTGEQRWDDTSGGWEYTAPVLADGTVCHGSAIGSLFAHDAESGAREWTFETGLQSDSLPATPIVADGVAFYGDPSGFYALTSDEN